MNSNEKALKKNKIKRNLMIGHKIKNESQFESTF